MPTNILRTSAIDQAYIKHFLKQGDASSTLDSMDNQASGS